jgi:hypothetical protein
MLDGRGLDWPRIHADKTLGSWLADFLARNPLRIPLGKPLVTNETFIRVDPRYYFGEISCRK